MNVNYIVYATPFFILLILLEIYVAYRLKIKGYYRLNDALTNLSIGLGDQVIAVFSKVVMLLMYDYLYQHYAIFNIPLNPLTFLVGLLIFDGIFYWAHRWGHEVNFMWGGHVVHHSSEEYNLTVALRQPWFFQWITFNLFLPMAILGFDTKILAVIAGFDILYQFWIHTKLIKSLGPLEWVLNTPSHHRVHHGVNPQYVDKNYGGVFIIWDRLFGTFEQEKEPVVFGITSPLKSWNPAWANVHYYVYLANLSSQCRTLADKLRVWIKPPGWKPQYLGGQEFPPPVSVATAIKFDTPTPRPLQVYLIVQYVIILALGTAYLYIAPTLYTPLSLLYCGYLLFTLVCVGWLLSNKPYARTMEFLRLAALPILFYMLPFTQQTHVTIALVTALILSSIGSIGLAWATHKG